MKISISYPPIINEFGQKAMVSQNRNVQYFKKPTYLLPVVHAQAATLLKNNKFDVLWDDGNASLKSFENWMNNLAEFNPDIIVLESTTPVMKFIWKTIDLLKLKMPNAIIVLTGYHSMRNPIESLKNSNLDIVMKSNHIDFCLLELCNFLKDNKSDWKKRLNISGYAYFLNNDFVDTGNFKLIENLNNSPIIDRDLVNWRNYAYENGNFLRTPGTYASSVIRDCIFGKCIFCRYNGPELSFSKMSIDKSISEYENLINNYGVKEIFDDSGVWYRGSDAREFAKKIIIKGLHKKNCYFGINTRFEYLDEETIKLLAKANFRFILIGLESGSQNTLNKLYKGYTKEGVENNLKLMKKYGLHPHLTVMVGYYWETEQDLNETVNFVKHLMFSGLARTLQVTYCTPLDFTPYHLDVIEKDLLEVNDYNDHDMSKIIVKTPIPKEKYSKAVKEMYGIAFHPKFILRQIIFLLYFRKRDWEFLFVYGYRAIRRVRQHLFNLTHRS